MRNPQGAGSPSSPRPDWSEAEHLTEGFAANSTTLKALQQRCRLTNAEAASVCGVAPRT
jgi:hypothetical protein